MFLTDKVILIVSPEQWGKNYVSKHHYALELSKRNNKVYFLNPKQAKVKNSCEKITDRLFVINYNSIFRGLNRFPFSLRKIIQCYHASMLIKIINHNIDIVWCFEPYRFQYLSVFSSALTIYHPVDIHKSNVERDIARNARFIFGSSDKILSRFSDVDKKIFKVNHGLNEYFLNPKKLSKSFIVNPNKINVGLVGNLHYPFLDCDTLSDIIQNNSELDFYFIGPTGSSNLSSSLTNTKFINFLNTVQNAFLLGTKRSEDLPSYLMEFDLFLICYTGDKNIDEMANPHKLIEYLSTGKPIVCHYIDEYRDRKDIICMADDNEALPSLFYFVSRNLKSFNSLELINKRKNIAKNNTYSLQIERIEKFLFNNNAF